MPLNYAGNQEEMFFDSQPWIDSDCEDFLSVNGGNISLNLSLQYIFVFILSSEELQHFIKFLSSLKHW